MSQDVILVSGCLAGLGCRYDGKRLCLQETVRKIVAQGRGIVVCPEQLGGLPTPRAASQIVGGDGFDVFHGKARVISEDGINVVSVEETD